MHSLRLKLILTFVIISVAGTVLTTLIVRQSSERAFDELLSEQAQTEFVSDMLAYYTSYGTWDGVNNDGAMPPQDQGPVPPSPFALADNNHRIIIPNGQYTPGSVVPQAVLDKGIALEIDGIRVGTVITDNAPPPRDPAENDFISQTNRALLFGALGATTLAVLIAIVMARTLTRPLQELSRASRQMALGDFQQIVPIRTQDELGELAAAFNQMSAELDRANQARRQMTADIAHDLRTPLTVLSGYLEVMEDGTLAPTPARLALMQEEVQTLQRLVTDLRTLSLTDTGHLTLHQEPVAVADLLTQVQNTFAHQAAQQEITLQVETRAALPEIALDPARIRQALGNLVSNALRYTPTQGSITLSAAASADGGIQIKIADTGSGIPEADLPHIFDRFYRGDRSRQEGHGGSGLGLAIAKALVLAHNGTITVKSIPGKGTTFTIALPGNTS